jgi:hypothetical protein
MRDETLLLRQVHPSFVQQGRVTSQAFRPTPKDQGLLSVYDGDLISPEHAWQHYAGTLGLASQGVMGVTVAQCLRESLPVTSDPVPFPEHAVIDFRALTDREVENKSKRLRMYAQARGWQYLGGSLLGS